MPVDPYIARGYQGGDDLVRTFLTLAAMKQRDQALAREQQQADAATMLDRERMGLMRDQADRTARADAAAQDTAAKKQQLAAIRWGLQQPNPAAALRSQGVEVKDDATAIALMRRQEAALAAALGEGPPGPKYERLGDSLFDVSGPTPKMVAQGRSNYAPEAPNRDIELARWWQNATPEQRAAWTATHPRPVAQERIYPDGMGGFYRLDEAGRMVPVEQAGPVGADLPAPQPAQPGRGAIVTVRTPEEAMALPPGTVFRTPDGRVKVRP